MVEQRSERSSESELKVTDRRLFTADGTLRDDVAAEEESSNEDEHVDETSETPKADPGFEHRPVQEPEGVDFTMLINAMTEPALLFLGELQPPGTTARVDLERARIQIDMLDLLRVKCRGNLSQPEEGHLDRILYQLRMLYVSKANEPNPSS